MNAVTELPRRRRTKASPVFKNVCCIACGASGIKDSRDCGRCGGSGFTRGPEHRGVALHALSPSERNLRDARRNSLNKEAAAGWTPSAA